VDSLRKRVAMIAGCTLLLGACQGPDYQAPPGTDGVAPLDLRVQGVVRSNGQVAQIEATLVDTAYRSLTGGDSLVLSAPDGASRVLESSAASDYVTSYVAQITTPSPTLTLELVRRDGSRHPTTFTLPPGFTITAPSATSRSTPMMATWEPDPSSPVTVSVATSPPTCSVAGRGGSYASDPGSVTLQPADFANVAGKCTVTISVGREIKATPNGKLGVGTVRLAQIRTLVLETQP